MRGSGHALVTLAALTALGAAAWPRVALGFAQVRTGDLELELRGNFRWNLIGTVPLDPDLPDADLAHTTFVRLIAESYVGRAVGLELHALQVVSDQVAPSLNASTFDLIRTGERNRSGALRWSQASEGALAFLELDRASVRLSLAPVDLTIGRQPISLATASLFTPNDFFAPFAAQALFRVYKPGVDAARLNIELGPFTYLTVYGVLGYDHGIEVEADDPVSLEQSSLLGRGVTSVGDFEISVLGGVVTDRVVIGGGVQGELFDWLGVRAEGHLRADEDEERDRQLLLSVGVERRFESSLFLQLEYFYNEVGTDDPDEYVRTIFGGLGDLPYLGRHQLGASASYELTPLLTGTLLVLTNLVDGSLLLTAYAQYSLLDEAELAFSLSAPVGEGPAGLNTLAPTIPSEYGLYPASASLELRAYF